MEVIDPDGSQLEVFLETSGSSTIKWKSRLLLVGFMQSGTYKMIVWYIDLESYKCGVAETFGDIPVSRREHPVTPSGSKLIMFGGEDLDERLLRSLRSECENSHCADEIEMLAKLKHEDGYNYEFNLEHMWINREGMTSNTEQLPIQKKANASNFSLNQDTYVGDEHTRNEEGTTKSNTEQLLVQASTGTDNSLSNQYANASTNPNEGKCNYLTRPGVVEIFVVNMSTLVVYMLTTVNVKDPLASEGLNISSLTPSGDNFFIKFGGYKEKCFNEELLKTHQHLAHNFQVRDFVDFLNEELRHVPETQLVLLSSPTEHENLEILGTSIEGGKTRAYWSKVEGETLSKSFMAINVELQHDSKKELSLFGRVAKLYNEIKLCLKKNFRCDEITLA